MLTGLAAGDLNGDSIPELVAIHISGTYLVVFDNQGNLSWVGDQLPQPFAGEFDAIGIADLDRDNSPEIYVRATVFRADGSFYWQGTEGTGGNWYYQNWPTWLDVTHAADLDMQGDMEILAGRTAYRSDGTIFWNNVALNDGYTATGNFDSDPYPEIVLVSRGEVYLLDHLGNPVGTPYTIPGATPTRGWGSSPVIANLDPDEMPEVVVVNGYRIEGLDWTGTGFAPLWSNVVTDHSQQAAATAFDFDGDGIEEILYRDEVNVYIFDGTAGSLLFMDDYGSGTGIEYPLVADIDNDGRAEVVVASCCLGAGLETGLAAYESEDWLGARPIWNQYAYHVTNVYNNGTIPQYEENSWEVTNNYLTQVGVYHFQEPALVTGGGWIPGEPPGPRNKRTFGFNAHSASGFVWGQLQFNDHALKMKIHSDTIKTVVVQPSDTIANFSGDCRVDGVSGYTFECEVMDRGEPGHHVDWFSIDISGPGEFSYSAGDFLGGGNIQIHKMPGRRIEKGDFSKSESDLEEEIKSNHHLTPKRVKVREDLASSQSLSQISPIIFSKLTAIRFQLKAPSFTTLKIYDMTGRVVAILVDGEMSSGTHTVAWKGDVPSGVYFFKLTAGEISTTGKFVVLK
jgi:hypothetical protein